MKIVPKPIAATIASRIDWRWVAASTPVVSALSCSREARITPHTATKIATIANGVSDSPRPITPHSTGIDDPVAVIGATMLIVPIASAW